MTLSQLKKQFSTVIATAVSSTIPSQAASTTSETLSTPLSTTPESLLTASSSCAIAASADHIAITIPSTYASDLHLDELFAVCRESVVEATGFGADRDESAVDPGM